MEIGVVTDTAAGIAPNASTGAHTDDAAVHEATTDANTNARQSADGGCSQPRDCMRLDSISLRQHSGTTSQGTEPTDTVDPKTALPHGHALLATTVLGRLSDAAAHTASEQWQAKTDMLALGFWNHATTSISNQPTGPNPAAKPTSSTTTTTPAEPLRAAQSGATLRRGRPPDPAKQPAFWYSSDLAFGYLQSDRFQSARPPDDQQSPKPSGRPPDDERSHKLHGWISKTTGGQAYGAATKTAPSQDTDGRGGTKNSRPRARARVGTSAGTLHSPAR